MLIPIRCFSCGHLLADKWNYYIKEIKKIQNDKKSIKDITINDLTIKDTDILDKHFDDNISKKILDDLHITRICCRRHFLSTIELIDTI